jgi:Ca-activated chloride channel homolog
MSFASPLWLLLLGLLPLVVILHSIAVRWRSTPVSSLLFWNEVLREKRTSIRVKQLLTNLALILELLAVAAFAVALAGPQVTRRGYGGSGDTILVLDATASMNAREGGRIRFDLARSKALEVISGQRKGARMALIEARHAPSLVVPFTDDREALRRAISAARVTDEPGDIADSVLFALSLRSERRDDQVVLVTDGAFDALGGVDTNVPWLHLVRVGTSRRNVAITGLSFRRTLGSGEAYEMFLAVKNYGPGPASVPVTVSTSPSSAQRQESAAAPGNAAPGAAAPALRRVAVSQTLSLAEGEEKSLSVPWTGPTTGRVEARIQTGDDFPLDDRAFAVFAPARQVNVLVVGIEDYFLVKALGALPGVTVRSAPSADILSSPSASTPGDVVIFNGVAPPELDKGNFIFLATVPANLPIKATGVLRHPSVTGWSRTDALLDSVPLSGLNIVQALSLDPGPGFTPLAMSHDSPLLLSWDQPGLKALIVAFSPASSDLPLRPGFPILLANALSWFFPSWLAVHADQVQTGSPRTFTAPDSGPVRVVMPDGTRQSVTPVGGSAEFYDTTEVGFYRVESAGGSNEFAASLTSASESDITPRFMLGAAEPSGGAAATAGQGAATSAAWAALAIAALALIVLEWLAWLRAFGGSNPRTYRGEGNPR